MNKAILSACVAAVIGMMRTTARCAEPTVSAQDLPRVKPTEPRDVMKTFQVRPGFHLELAAAEPLVIDPIAMAFDADGAMYVVEMRDYSERRMEKLSRIRRLEDTDGDGVYDKATIFLDNLPWATAVTCVNGGLLVGACPDVLFARDTNGDGVADEQKIVFTGFGSTQEKLNVQGLFNNFIWGPDNRIHGCSGHDGGMVRALLHPDQPPIDVRGKGFVIDPRDWSITTENGGGQYGLSFDPWGRLFTCENSSHLELFMADARYASRNPYYTMPNPLVSIAADGPAAEVYRISPEEPWRVIRTRWRVGGLVGGPIEGGGRSAGYFTGATGATLYKGNAFGKEYVGDAFIGDAGGNLVHHKRIRPDGVGLIAQRPDDEKAREFVASTDNWFRPVDFANAPDGTLYIADMYRETIEHPWSIPPQIKQFLDLNSGNDRGRIYRLAPDGFKPSTPPRLSNASTAELVNLLGHPNAWHRETASRLLFERQDKSAVPLLKDLLRKSPEPLGRMNALCAISGLGSLDEADVIEAMSDSDPAVREQAVKRSDGSEAVWSALAKLAQDSSPRVRYQVAFTLGEIHHPGRNELLAAIAKRDIASPWTRYAVLSSLAEGAGDVFDALWPDLGTSSDDAGRSMLKDLAQVIGAANQSADIDRVVARLTAATDQHNAIAVARGLFEGAARTNSTAPVRTRTTSFLQSAQTLAASPTTPTDIRVEAIDLLGYGEFDSIKETLLSLIGTRQKSPVATATLAALDRFDSPAVSEAILTRWNKLSAREKEDAVTLLAKRPTRAIALLNAVQAGTVPADDIGAQQVTFLQSHRDPAVQQLAKKLLIAPSAKREAVVEQYRSSLSLTGDRAKGKLLYQQRCISCHRLEGEGNAVGPDLVTVKNSGKEKLLLSILDPSREMAANYVSYLIETTDGQTLLGIISNDSTSTLTLRQPYGKEIILPRNQIKRMTSQGKSLMPDGLETGLPPQGMADLLEFISTARK